MNNPLTYKLDNEKLEFLIKILDWLLKLHESGETHAVYDDTPPSCKFNILILMYFINRLIGVREYDEHDKWVLNQIRLAYKTRTPA